MVRKGAGNAGHDPLCTLFGQQDVVAMICCAFQQTGFTGAAGATFTGSRHGNADRACRLQNAQPRRYGHLLSALTEVDSEWRVIDLGRLLNAKVFKMYGVGWPVTRHVLDGAHESSRTAAVQLQSRQAARFFQDRPKIKAMVRLASSPGPGAGLSGVASSGGSFPAASAPQDMAGTGFAITHRPAERDGWLELLASGLAFDVTGLAPGEAAPFPPHAHRFGLDSDIVLPGGYSAISLVPGGHLAGGEGLLPVVRVTAALAVRIAMLPGVVALGWHPARCVVGRDVFCRMVMTWLGGGAFPALALTALARDSDGGLRSEGLGFFTGQELRIEPVRGQPAASDAKLAVRLIHALVDGGAVTAPFATTDTDGTGLLVEPSSDGRCVHVWRKN